ncbi:hypothetical protein TrVE_jg8261 [Triparma verrucosa]|nr:hypothetical protein TrVE_jg8261 [Triparma verrucosa]
MTMTMLCHSFKLTQLTRQRTATLPLTRLSSSLSEIREIHEKALSLAPPATSSASSEWSLNIAHLLTHHLNLPPNTYSSIFNKNYPPNLNLSSPPTFFSDVTRLTNSEPIQYILGSWDFYTLSNVLCSAPVLIPRPETEDLITILLTSIPPSPAAKKLNIIDVGTGTGCIGISILKELPNVNLYGVEPGVEAYNLTNLNINKFEKEFKHNSDYVKLYGCGIEDLEEIECDYIISNPPYIPTRDMEGLDDKVIRYEDYKALWGGEDGLDVIREVLRYAEKVGGKVFGEGDEGCVEGVRRFVGERGEVEGRKDFMGKERFFIVSWL